jgi:hypothetical protein
MAAVTGRPDMTGDDDTARSWCSTREVSIASTRPVDTHGPGSWRRLAVARDLCVSWQIFGAPRPRHQRDEVVPYLTFGEESVLRLKQPF